MRNIFEFIFRYLSTLVIQLKILRYTLNDRFLVLSCNVLLVEANVQYSKNIGHIGITIH